MKEIETKDILLLGKKLIVRNQDPMKQTTMILKESKVSGICFCIFQQQQAAGLGLRRMEYCGKRNRYFEPTCEAGRPFNMNIDDGNHALLLFHFSRSSE